MVVYGDNPGSEEINFSILHELTSICIDSQRDDELIKILEFQLFDFNGIRVKDYWDLIYEIRQYAYRTLNVVVETSLQSFEKNNGVNAELNLRRESILWSMIESKESNLTQWHQRRVRLLYKEYPGLDDYEEMIGCKD